MQKIFIFIALLFCYLPVMANESNKAPTLPHSLIINHPLCSSDSTEGKIILTTIKNVMDDKPLEHFEFYLQHEKSKTPTRYIPQYIPAANASTAIFSFYPLATGSYTLFVSYYFSNGFFNQSGELLLDFTINPIQKMEVSYTKKDISGMQCFDGELEIGKSGFVVFNFDSIKNGTPPFEIFYKELCIETSFDTLFFAYPVPVYFTVWDYNNCYLDIHDSIVILPDTLHIGISLDKPLIYSDGIAVSGGAHLSILQYNKPEVLLIDWYKNGTLIKSGMENFLFDVDTGDYYAIGYGQRTGLISSSRIRVVVDSVVPPIDTIIPPIDTVVHPIDTVIPPIDTIVQPIDTLTPCDSTIIADFWLCSEFILHDIGLAVNVSQTSFDSILWLVPRETELLYQDYYELELQFNDTGTFNVGMIGYYNSCIATKQVQVKVKPPYQRVSCIASQQYSIIQNLSIYPQPIISTSNIEIETTEDALIDISIYNATTGILTLTQKLNVYANERTIIPLHYERIHSGVSFIRITTTRNSTYNHATGDSAYSGNNAAIGSNANDIRTIKIIKL